VRSCTPFGGTISALAGTKLYGTVQLRPYEVVHPLGVLNFGTGWQFNCDRSNNLASPYNYRMLNKLYIYKVIVTRAIVLKAYNYPT